MKKAEKRRIMIEVKRLLAEAYPDAKCALEYEGDPWKLLIMARLSAQCKDERVNQVCKVLFAKYPDTEALANGEIEEIGRIIRTLGLYTMKARNIRDVSRELLLRYGGRVPDTMEELLAMPGVGRKTANLLLGDLYGKPAIVCDTHFMRIMGRIGMYAETNRDPEWIEDIMRDIMDITDGSEFCHRVVQFGRDCCTAWKPKCERCPLSEICEHGNTLPGSSY